MDFKPLNAATNEIRLLTLQPSTPAAPGTHESTPYRHDDPVNCELENLPLERNLNSNQNLTSRLEALGSYWCDLKDLNIVHAALSAFMADGSIRASLKYRVRRAFGQKMKYSFQGRYSWGDYVALSYTWGDPTKTKEIFVNGKSVQVTVNLEHALRILRNKLPMRVGVRLWVDALCVNQADVEEKNLQVQRMRDIYKQA
jgi:hypothetical protein